MALRYIEIAGQLRQRIVDGSYAPHTRLPSNRELALEFGTTLVTVRKALDRLTEAAWLRVEHGVGTYVADVGRNADLLVSFTPSSVQGADALHTVLERRARRARNGAAAAELGNLVGADLVRVDRLRLANGQPVLRQSSYLDGRHTAALADYAAAEPLYVFLRDRLGLIATTSREVIDVQPVAAADAARLDVPAGTPVLRSRRTSYADDNRPFLFDEAVIVADRMPLVIERAGTRSVVHFEVGGAEPRAAEAAL